MKVGGRSTATRAPTAGPGYTAAKGAIARLGGKAAEVRHFTLPDGSARTLVICEKISATPAAYPRNGGKIAKSPLK